MAYTASQQARLDAAKARLDNATAAWALAVDYWNTNFMSVKCYTDTKFDAVAAATWFTPNDSSCSQAKNCTVDDKRNCKDKIYFASTRGVQQARTAYPELLAAQQNYDTVIAQVNSEVQHDPAFILQQQQIQATAQVSTASAKQRYIFYAIAVVVIGVVIYLFRKQ